MREDIVSMIGSKSKLTHILITTFNIDFVFIETVLLRQLRRCGHPSLTILADADEVEATFVLQGPWVGRVGRRYRVVPIRMEPGFRFHPKGVLLSGPDDAELLIGSGNLTFGGMRQNEEIWARFNAKEDGEMIAAFREMVEVSLDRSPHPAPAKQEVAEAYAVRDHAWAQQLPDAGGLLARPLVRQNLLEQMTQAVGEMAVRRMIVVSPYFDDNGVALEQLAAKWPDANLEVFVQEGKSQLTDTVWQRIREPKYLHHAHSSRDGEGAPFIHAKAYGFADSEQAVVFVGSANCSQAALTLGGSLGNAELLVPLRLPASEVDSQLLDGISTLDTPPKLRAEPEPKSDAVTAKSAKIHSAQLDQGRLAIRFSLNPDATFQALRVDRVEIEPDRVSVDESSVRLRWQGQASRVQIVYLQAGEVCLTAEHWVDQEFLLTASNKQRQLVQHLGETVTPGQWTFQGWTEVMRLLGDHLKHAPEVEARSPGQQEKPDHPTEIDSESFLSGSYHLQSHRAPQASRGEAARLAALRGLLLSHIGIDYEEADTEDANPDSDNEEEVDRPTQITKKRSGHKKKRSRRDSPGLAERKRGKKIATEVMNRYTAADYVQLRPAPLLSVDLSIAAVMLISGHAESWLPGDLFLDFTYRLWTHMFFDDGASDDKKDPPIGALSRRVEASANPDWLISELVSPRLTASLALWCFSYPGDVSGTEAARFSLATRLSVARTPWLWSLNDLDAVEEELYAIADRTGWLGEEATDRWDGVLAAWSQLFEEGLALRDFENALRGQSLEELREKAPTGLVPAGTLLWQGGKIGFGVLSANANRVRGNQRSVPVLSLRHSDRDLMLQPFYLLPFEVLLDAASEANWMKQHRVQALRIFGRRLLSAKTGGAEGV
ncbi:MAG: hypothetical protein ACPGYV_01035 [Phycisphaeraceae bacterium]